MRLLPYWIRWLFVALVTAPRRATQGSGVKKHISIGKKVIPVSLIGLGVLLIANPAPLGAQQTIPLLGMTNTIWRYLQGQCPEAGWEQADYDDRWWPSGPALLAFENNPAIAPMVHTMLQPPSDLNGQAVYFRTYFKWSNATATVTLQFSNRVDDCSVIYLNGRLLTNAGVSGSPITCTNFGRIAIGGDATTAEVFQLPATLLAGANFLAVEVHQQNASSGDVVWGCELSVVLPRANIRLAGTEINIGWSAEQNIVYRLEHCPDLSAGNWTTLRDCLTSTNASAYVTANIRDHPMGFYRIAISDCVLPR